jgi:hypothetical protein
MVVETERTVSIEEWGISQPVILKRITAQNRASLMREMATPSSMKVRKGDDMTAEMQPTEAIWESDIYYVAFCIKEAPFISNPKDVLKTRKELGEQDWELIEYLKSHAEDLNRPFVMKDKETDSDEDSQTTPRS